MTTIILNGLEGLDNALRNAPMMMPHNQKHSGSLVSYIHAACIERKVNGLVGHKFGDAPDFYKTVNFREGCIYDDNNLTSNSNK